MTMIVQSSPAMAYCPPVGCVWVVVVEEPLVVVEPLLSPGAAGCVMVVFVVDVVDHGCHAKSAMRIATITTSVMPTAAPPPPP